jgi:DNA ligase-1
MRLSELVEASGRVAETRSKKSKIGVLADLLRRTAPDEAAIAVAYLSGQLPQGRIGIGPAAVRAAMEVAPALEPGLALAEVDAAFTAIAGASGPGSAREKAERLGVLLGRATGDEQRFLVRLVLGELRQGALEGMVAEAVAAAANLPPERVRRAAMLAGDLPAVARAALAEGEAGLAGFALDLFRPLSPMLAQPAGDVGEALGRLGEASLEHKLDGARIQVHKGGDEVRVFSRSLHDVTAAVPEVVAAARALPARSAILDGETIALREDGAPHPFQVTMRRFGRRLDVERMRAELPLATFWFDLLHLDGADLIDEPQRRRFAALSQLAVGASYEEAGGGTTTAGVLVPSLVTADPAAAEAFLRTALDRGHEGVMAKDPAAAYAAGSRGSAWLKVKPAHTLDLVVLAAEWGHGRRQGWLSNLHLGARDTERGGYVMLGKTFKGLTDRTLEWQTREILAREIGRDRWTVHARPELVVEIAFNDLQESPRYPGGLALRFARVVRYRGDKTAADADTFAAVRDLYRKTTGREPPEPR